MEKWFNKTVKDTEEYLQTSMENGLSNIKVKKRQDENGEKWYCTEKGWLSEISINVYSNRYKAQKVAEEILSK